VFPDIYVTNICFGGPDLKTAYLTLSATGQLVSLPWPEPGLRCISTPSRPPTAHRPSLITHHPENTMNRRELITALAGGCGASLLGAMPSHAASPYPNRQVRVVVPFTAGGGTDWSRGRSR
jgi:hypothetical protein